MAYSQRRPLPTPPMVSPFDASVRAIPTPHTSPHLHSSPYPIFAPRPNAYDPYSEPPTTLPGGTLLHKGFYDLLAMIPTPSPSRLFWSSPPSDTVIAGPRYEDLTPGSPVRTPNRAPVSSSPTSPRKGRRISKDMVSKPTGFVYVVTFDFTILHS
jgi:protein-serine/threonine kinase